MYCSKCHQKFYYNSELERHERNCPKRSFPYDNVTHANCSQMDIIQEINGKSACTTISLEAALFALHLGYDALNTPHKLEKITANGVSLYGESHKGGPLDGEEAATVYMLNPRFSETMKSIFTHQYSLVKRDYERSQIVKYPLKQLFENIEKERTKTSLALILTKPPETICLFFPRERKEMYLFNSHPKNGWGTHLLSFSSSNQVQDYLEKEFYHLDEEIIDFPGMEMYFQISVLLLVKEKEAKLEDLCNICHDEKREKIKKMENGTYCHISCSNQNSRTLSQRNIHSPVQQRKKEIQEQEPSWKEDQDNLTSIQQTHSKITDRIDKVRNEFEGLLERTENLAKELEKRKNEEKWKDKYQKLEKRVAQMTIKCPTFDCNRQFLCLPTEARELQNSHCNQCKKTYCFYCQKQVETSHTCQTGSKNYFNFGETWKECPNCKKWNKKEDELFRCTDCSFSKNSLKTSRENVQ